LVHPSPLRFHRIRPRWSRSSPPMLPGTASPTPLRAPSSGPPPRPPAPARLPKGVSNVPEHRPDLFTSRVRHPLPIQIRPDPARQDAGRLVTHDLAVEEVDRPLGVARITRIVRHHDDRRAALV